MSTLALSGGQAGLQVAGAPIVTPTRSRGRGTPGVGLWPDPPPPAGLSSWPPSLSPGSVGPLGAGTSEASPSGEGCVLPPARAGTRLTSGTAGAVSEPESAGG